jgi:hypothetical protein
MADEQKQPETTKWAWVKPKEGTPQIYTNYVHVSWTFFDVRFQLGQLVPIDPLSSEFAVAEQGAVTVAWPEAKSLRDMLIDLVARYEETNGEIKPLKLPPNTPSTDKNE